MKTSGREPRLLSRGWSSPASVAAGSLLTRRRQGGSASGQRPKTLSGQPQGKRGEILHSVIFRDMKVPLYFYREKNDEKEYGTERNE